jgi:predicted transcriptional regulator
MILLLDDVEKVRDLFEALSSTTRIKILLIIRDKQMSVSELSEKLKLSKADISNQVSFLEKVGLVETSYLPGVKGVKKLVRLKEKEITILLGGGFKEG